jgi:hypothetical protein
VQYTTQSVTQCAGISARGVGNPAVLAWLSAARIVVAPGEETSRRAEIASTLFDVKKTFFYESRVGSL